MRDFDANAACMAQKSSIAAFVAAAHDAGGTAVAKPANDHAVAHARAHVARALGASPDEVFFTGGGTAAAALAFFLAHATVEGRPMAVAISAMEHAAVRGLATAGHAAGALRLQLWPASPAGVVAPPTGPARLDLVSVLSAHNETGVVQPIPAVVACARAAGAFVHTDAVQAVGRMPVHFARQGVDMLTLAGHKFGAVGGVGVLLVARTSALHKRARAALRAAQTALFGAWAAPSSAPVAGAVFCPKGAPWRAACAAAWHLAAAAEANVAGIVALAAALPEVQPVATWRRLAQLRDAFEAGLIARVGPARCKILGQTGPRLGNTSALLLPGCEAEGVLMALDLSGFAVSAGAACAAGALEPSPSLLALGLSDREARQVVRISLPAQADGEGVAALQDHLARIIVAQASLS